MGRGYYLGGWAPYVRVGDRLANGRQAARALAKKENREPSPVMVTTRDIAKTFWGRSWCDNLERYSDFANRLPRGRTYLRNGSVADLVVEPGVIRALVCGSDTYKVVIKIKPLGSGVWKAIEKDCAREIGALIDLLQGKFSHAIMQRLTRVEDGLFPAISEISMSCSCPDGSVVCKHVAATIYGVGARLDSQPDLLFKLRQVNHLDLIATATSSKNLDQALSMDQGTLETEDLGSLFGIELESDAEPAKPKQRSAKAVKKPADPAKKAAAVKTPAAKEPVAPAPPAKIVALATTVPVMTAEKAAAKTAAASKATTKTAAAKGVTTKGAATKGAAAKGAAAKSAATKRKAATETAVQPAAVVQTIGVAVTSINKKTKAASMKEVIKATIARALEAQKQREQAGQPRATQPKAARSKSGQAEP